MFDLAIVRTVLADDQAPTVMNQAWVQYGIWFLKYQKRGLNFFFLWYTCKSMG